MPFTIIPTNAANERPAGAILHYNGKVYCGNANGGIGKGYIVNPDDNTFASFTLPSSDYIPRALTLDGRILYTGRDNGKPWLMVNEDGTYTTLNEWIHQTHKACLTRDGKILIGDISSNNFGLLNPRNNFFEFLPNKPAEIVSDPYECSILPDGKYFLTFNSNTKPFWIFNPFNNLWEAITITGYTHDQSNKSCLLYDGGTMIIGEYYGVRLVNIYSKKIIASAVRANSHIYSSLLISPDGDVFYVSNGNNGIAKYTINNNTIQSVGIAALPSGNNYPTGACVLPSGNIFYTNFGSTAAENAFVIWNASLGALPVEVCLSTFYNRG